MSTLVHAVFDDTQTAHRAVERARELAEIEALRGAEVHAGHVRQEEMPMPGTDALRGTIVGSLLVGGFGALFAGLVIWPMNGHWFGWDALLMIFLGASLFGGVAGGLAGASEARTSIRDSASRLKSSEAMLTWEVEDADVDQVCEILTAHGGRFVQAA